MFTSPIFIWLMVGIGLYVVDKMQSKYKLVNASYAAFLISLFLMIGIMRTPDRDTASYYHYFVIGQVVCFGLAIPAFAFAFRDAAPKSKLGRSKEYYDALIGKTVEVGIAGINSVRGGKVSLDGEVYQAKLEMGSEVESLDAGAQMIIKDSVGDTLIVAPKN